MTPEDREDDDVLSEVTEAWVIAQYKRLGATGAEAEALVGKTPNANLHVQRTASGETTLVITLAKAVEDVDVKGDVL